MTVKGTEILLFVVCIILCILLARSCNKGRATERKWQAISDTLQLQVDNHGRTIGRIKQVSSSRKDAVDALTLSNDSLNIALAAMIKKAGRRAEGATIVKTETKIIKETSTVVEFDTIYINSVRTDSFIIGPIYSGRYSDKWINYSIKAQLDTIEFRGTFHNQLNMAFKRKRKFTQVSVMDSNPYAAVSDVTSWQIKRKPRRFGLGIHVGAGIDTDLKIRPQAGLSLSYQFIQF